MTTTFPMKQGDLLPQLQVVLQRTDPITGVTSAVDLTTATRVSFFMSSAVAGLVVEGQGCLIAPDQMADTGLVSYTWQDGDTDLTGKFKGEFEVTWASGKDETFPGDGYLLVVIRASLDGA